MIEQNITSYSFRQISVRSVQSSQKIIQLKLEQLAQPIASDIRKKVFLVFPIPVDFMSCRHYHIWSKKSRGGFLVQAALVFSLIAQIGRRSKRKESGSRSLAAIVQNHHLTLHRQAVQPCLCVRCHFISWSKGLRVRRERKPGLALFSFSGIREDGA